MIEKLVSIIIPTHNRLGSLTRTIESILKQKYSKYEIIVIDDASTDGTPSELTKYDEMRVVSTKNRVGPSHARNLGILESNGEYLWFLDSDVVLPDENIMEKMVSTINGSSKIGSLGGEIVVHELSLDKSYGRNIRWNAKNIRCMAYENTGLTECDYLATCNCFTRAVFAARINGFDEQFVFGAEDMDFGVRLKQLGLMNYVGHDAAVHHYHEKTGRYEHETTYYQKTRIQFAKKHYGKFRLFAMFLIDFVDMIKFYVLILPKLVLMLLLKKKITKQNIFGGWYALKYYFSKESKARQH